MLSWGQCALNYVLDHGIWYPHVGMIRIKYVSTLICAIRMPYTNLLTLHTIFYIYDHNNKDNSIKFWLSYIWENKVKGMSEMVLTQDNLYGWRDNLFTKETSLHISLSTTCSRAQLSPFEAAILM